MPPLPRSFYDRTALEVARDLLGCVLVRVLHGERLAGAIIETEAYQGPEDLGCHARAGLTARNAVMFGEPGHAYIYFNYGVHWLLNAVSGPGRFPSAVLLRAMLPLDGLERMAALRPRAARSPHWTDGPAKLTQAIAVNGALNGADLCDPAGELRIEPGRRVPDEAVQATARIGLYSVPEPWKSIPWRFVIKNYGSTNFTNLDELNELEE